MKIFLNLQIPFQGSKTFTCNQFYFPVVWVFPRIKKKNNNSWERFLWLLNSEAQMDGICSYNKLAGVISNTQMEKVLTFHHKANTCIKAAI